MKYFFTIIIVTTIFFLNIAPTFAQSNITPTQDTITINGTVVNNFYKNALRTNSNNDALLVDNQKYQVTYIAPDKKFLITILEDPFEKNSQDAQKELLNVLNIPESEACWLDISISAYKTLEETKLGFIEPSFCTKHQSRRMRDKTTDVNLDGTTNTIDYILVLNEYGRKEVDIPSDINGDMKINTLDLTLVIYDLGKPKSLQL